MLLNTLPKKIWSVFNDGARAGRFTTRQEARTFKSELQLSGATSVTLFSQTVTVGDAILDTKS